MNSIKPGWFVTIAVCVCASAPTHAQQTITQDVRQDVTNRLTLSGRLGFNISARFSGLSSFPTPASARKTSKGDAYNYDDGYVLTDNSGNFGGQTWYWGYDNSSRQISGNNLVLSHSTVAGGAGAVTLDDDPSYGAELVYRRLLNSRENGMQLGIELAGNYLNLSMSGSSTLIANAIKTSYPFAFTPGTTPPDATPAAPYLGSYEGPGFVIDATPGAPTTTPVPGAASIQGHRQFDADLWGMRLGPYLEFPVSNKLKLSLSGGLAGALVDADVSWSETASIGAAQSPAVSGSGHTAKTQWGFYVAGNAFWEFSPQWSAVLGLQYQNLHDFSHSFGGRRVTLDLSQSFFVTFGVSFNF